MKRNSSDLKEQRDLQLVALEEVAKAKEVPCPEDRASCWSRATLSFLTPLLGKGVDITLRDIGRPKQSDVAAEVSARFQRTWAPAVARYDAAKAGGAASPKVPDLFTSQLRAIDGGLCRFLFACVCFFAEGLLQLVPVLCLRVLVLHFEQNDEDLLSTRAQWTIVAALYLAPSLGSLARARYDTEMVHVGCQMYSACSLALYEKALRLSPTARGDYEAGKIVTLFTVDAFSVQKLLLFIGILFSGPIIIVLCLYFIYQLVGEAMWIGLGFMIVCVPLQVAIFIPFLALQKAYLKAADERVKLMNEVLGGVRVVKFLAWERPFLEKITALRAVESKILWKQSKIISVGFAVVMLGAPIFQPVLIFAYYTQKMGRELDSSTAFATLSLFSLLRLPLAFLPFCLIQFLTYQVSAKRMAAFLTQPELDERKGGGNGAALAIEDGTFAWSTKPPVRDEKGDDEDAGLKDGKKKPEEEEAQEGRDRRPGEPAGAAAARARAHRPGRRARPARRRRRPRGQRQVEPARGHRRRDGDHRRRVKLAPGAVAFCAQVPWVLNATVRDNVLFGADFDGDRFAACVRRCALADDLAQLPGGALCEIGERGINVSGGQKARISLARAAYSDCAVVLLDDPLSAVDAHVALHLFDECIAGDAGAPGSLGGRTRVLVTHHAKVLPRCDVVVVVKDGRIVAKGTYDELAARGVDMGELTVEEQPEEVKDVQVATKLIRDDEPVLVEATGLDAVVAEAVEADVAAHSLHEDEELEGLHAAEQRQLREGALVKDEKTAEGLVSNMTWIVFAKAGGSIWLVVALTVMVAGRASEIGGQFFLARWTSNHKDPNQSTVMDFVYYYLYYALGAVIALAIRALVLAYHRIKAASTLHATVVERVLFAPTAFFDVTPVGRILNRFSGDMLTLDTELSRNMSEFCGIAMYVVGAIVALCAATKGLFLALFIPMGYAYRCIDRRFRTSSTQIARLAKLARSPVIADFSEILNGVATVRAYDAVKRFEDRLRSRLDALAACVVLEQLCYNWLSVRLDQLAALSSAAVAALAVGTRGGFMNAGFLGLALMSTIEVTGFLKNAVRLSSLLASNMASACEVVAKRMDPPPDCWAPTKGAVTFKGARMRYRDGPLVLKGIDVEIPGGAHVGVVGRTGSGKSSLTAALFRVVELCGGSCEIDGADAAELGLRELRRGLFIIPQDPILFSASLRFNVDPFDEYTEHEVKDALERAELGPFVASLTNGLDELLQEGGSNLSVGQRQLVCIARALLRKPKILVLDEATASIDNETDAAIQKQIRTNFKASTTITIAHRLHTILDSDLVLVLDDGHVLEFDAPKALLAKDGSAFKALVDSAKLKHSSSSNLLALAMAEEQ
ncbi:ATPase [Aureococcus anophagefferens]|nr:ATPase [Aureococcus anophagefferens]